MLPSLRSESGHVSLEPWSLTSHPVVSPFLNTSVPGGVHPAGAPLRGHVGSRPAPGETCGVKKYGGLPPVLTPKPEAQPPGGRPCSLWARLVPLARPSTGEGRRPRDRTEDAPRLLRSV